MKNKLKLSLINFQSITNGELEFETGLNFIIGQSNSGKSATFRALKACLSNPIGSQRFIKKDTNIAEVILEYNDNVIDWKRTKTESSYNINGEEYVKTGRSDAFKIIANTGFVKDHNDVIMNIEEELQLPFPYGISKIDLFKLFENIFCVSDSAIILKSAKNHENEVKSDIELLENEISKVKNKLSELKKFQKEISLNKLKSTKDKVVKQQNNLNKLNEGIEIIRTAVELNKLKLPKPQDFNNKLEQYEDFYNTKNLINKLLELHGISQTIKEVKVPQSVDLREYKELITIQKDLVILNNLLKIKPDESFKLKQIDLNKYTDLKKMVKELNILRQLVSLKFPTYNIQSRLEEYENLVQYRDELRKIMAAGKNAVDKKKSISKKLSEIQEQLKTYKVCPLCHKPLNE